MPFLVTGTLSLPLYPRTYPVYAGVGPAAVLAVPTWSCVFARLTRGMTMAALAEGHDRLSRSDRDTPRDGRTATLALLFRLP